MPTLMTFADLNDPKTGRAIRPGEFEQVFGTGVMLRDAKIEIVSAGTWPLTMFGLSGEPITRGIERKFPWWGEPLPWMQPQSPGVYADARRGGFRWGPWHFKSGG